MNRTGALLTWLTLAPVLAACQQEVEERPPSAPGCNGPRCVPVGGLPPSNGSGSGGRSAGEGGTDGGGESSELTGSIRELVDDGFHASQPFTGIAKLSAEGATGGLVTTSWNGVDPFGLNGVKRSSATWILVAPERSQGVLPTIHPVDTRQRPEVDLGLVRADNLDLVFLLLTVPGERLSGKGQLILAFVERASSGGGKNGVRVALPEAEFISYASQGTWSELETETDTSGLVVLGNIPAPPFPGITKQVKLGGTRSGTIDLRIAADAVSLVEVAPL